MDRRTFLAGIGAGAVVSTLPAAASVPIEVIAAPTGVAAAITASLRHVLYYEFDGDVPTRFWLDGEEIKGQHQLDGLVFDGRHMEVSEVVERDGVLCGQITLVEKQGDTDSVDLGDSILRASFLG